MSRYKIVESIGRHLEEVHRYEDLEIHHFSKNKTGLRTGRSQDFEPGRPHQRVDGRFEEVQLLPDGRLFVKKDFVLSHDGPSPVYIPSPVSGYVHYLHDKTATLCVYDRPHEDPKAKLLVQVLHMDRHTFHLKEGDPIAYGQPMGVMSNTGSPSAIHAHVEMEPVQFRQYIHDIDSGAITPDHYPTKISTGHNATRATTLVGDAGYAAGESSFQSSHHESTHLNQPVPSLVNPLVELQQQLNHLGYRGPHGHALTIDGTAGPNTEHAIKSFQRAHQLHVDGVAGKDTLAALVDARHAPLLSEATHPAHSLYTQVLHGVRKLPHGTFRSEDEQRNLAVALSIAAHVGGLQKVDHVVLGTNGVNVFAVEGRIDDPAHLRTHVDRVQAMMHPVDQSSLALQQAGHTNHLHVPAHTSPDVGQRLR